MNSEYKNQYLTFEVLSPGSISWRCTANNSTYYRSIYYRVKNVNTSSWTSWTRITSSYSSQYLITGTTAYGSSFPIGSKIQVKATTNQAYGNDQSDPAYFYNSFGGTAETKVYGNILSLLIGDNVTSLTEESFTSLNNIQHMFAGLFLDYINLKDVKDLWLSVDQLSSYCYAKMFDGCQNIEEAPELLTEDLTYQGCCEMMFYNCSSLKFIKCTSKHFGQFSCNSWTHGVDVGGHFVTADGIGFRTSGEDSTQNDYDGWIMNENGIPKTWTISTLSEYEGGGTDPGDQGGDTEPTEPSNQNLPYQKYKLKIDKSDTINWPTSQSNEKIIIKVDGSIGHKVIISKENNNERKYFDFYKYDDSDYADAFATDSPRSLTDGRKVSFEKAFVKEYNSVNNHTRQISGFQSEFSKFFASNSFTNPTSSNNAFAYLRSNVINKDSTYYSSTNIAYL